MTLGKAKVEAGVLLVERWILAALRKRTFFSLGEVSEAIAELLVRLTHLRQFASKDRCNSLILLAGAASGAEL
jgi:hypothetical protein